MKQFLQSVIHFKSHRLLISNKVKIKKKKITYKFFVAEKEKSHSESQQTFEEVVKERDQVKWDALQSNCKKLIWKGSIWFVIGYKLYLVGCVFPISNESWWVVKKKNPILIITKNLEACFSFFFLTTISYVHKSAFPCLFFWVMQIYHFTVFKYFLITC